MSADQMYDSLLVICGLFLLFVVIWLVVGHGND